jgi:membrane-associated protein
MNLPPFLQELGTLEELVLHGGYPLLFLMVFAETGLFAGFFLPGDSLLITAGLIAASGSLDLTTLLLLMTLGAVLGDSVGYLIGTKLSKSIFSKQETLFFHPEHLEKTRLFYERHGAKTVFLARFVPVVRSFASTLAGVSGMPYPQFFFFSVAGAATWVAIFTLVGYFVASIFPEIVEYLHLVILGGIALIVLSAVMKLRQSKKRQQGGKNIA